MSRLGRNLCVLNPATSLLPKIWLYCIEYIERILTNISSNYKSSVLCHYARLILWINLTILNLIWVYINVVHSRAYSHISRKILSINKVQHTSLKQTFEYCYNFCQFALTPPFYIYICADFFFFGSVRLMLY